MATRRMINVRLTELEIEAALKAIERLRPDRGKIRGTALSRAKEKLYRAWSTLRRLSRPRETVDAANGRHE